jgi:rieske iron-sulfur protein
MSVTAISIKSLTRKTRQQEPVAEGDKLVFAVGANKDGMIKRESLQMNEATFAFPENKDSNQENFIIVCRLDPSRLVPPTKLEWTVEGFVAYSAICTHLGCTAYFSQRTEERPFPHLLCPCHGGVYDPQRGAMVMAGPVPRALPQLPVKINDLGELIAGGWFHEPPGVVSKSELKRWREGHKS